MPATNDTARDGAAKLYEGCGIGPDDRIMAGGHDWSWAFVVFRPIPDYPGYVAGSDGTIWSCLERRRRSGQRGGMDWVSSDRWHRLNPWIENRYPRVRLTRAGHVRRLENVHILVLLAFHGPRPPRHEGCHWNGIATDPRAINLRWDTKAANQRDQQRHGTLRRGLDNHKSKLDPVKVVEIRRKRAEGMTLMALAEMYGVRWTSINQVCKRQSWKHVT